MNMREIKLTYLVSISPAILNTSTLEKLYTDRQAKSF